MSEAPNPFEPPQSTPLPTASLAPPEHTFTACPYCGQTVARRVGFTLWGGVLGPKLLTHVKCQHCGGKYNGKTGRSNTTAIVLYVVGSALVGFIAAVAIGVWALLSR